MITLPYTDIIDLKSKYNDFEYSLFIRFPNEYKDDNKHYPTLFLLDPEYLFSICYDIFSIYTNYIIVGVGHKDLDFKELDAKTREERNLINRARDFLPWKVNNKVYKVNDGVVLASGQAEKFAEFINYQVIPLIDNKFRTTQDRTLIGHSFGGVFVSFMLLCYPENFLKYIAITPVLAPEYYLEDNIFGALKKKFSDTKKLIYFGIDGEAKDSRVDDYIGKLEKSCLEIIELSRAKYKIEIIAGENHASVVTPSIWRGLKFLNN